MIKILKSVQAHTFISRSSWSFFWRECCLTNVWLWQGSPVEKLNLLLFTEAIFMDELFWKSSSPHHSSSPILNRFNPSPTWNNWYSQLLIPLALIHSYWPLELRFLVFISTLNFRSWCFIEKGLFCQCLWGWDFRSIWKRISWNLTAFC